MIKDRFVQLIEIAFPGGLLLWAEERVERALRAKGANLHGTMFFIHERDLGRCDGRRHQALY